MTTRPSASRHRVDRSETTPLRVLFVGDFSASRVGNFSVAEELARRLSAQGVRVHTTSARRGRAGRVADMVMTALRLRGSVDVAVVDVYSGRAFLWAEWAVGILRIASVPVILVLRGGGLPDFAAGQPERVRRLLGRGSAVVALSDFLRVEMSSYRSDIVVVPNPIDLADYPFHVRSTAEPKLVWLRSFHGIYNPTLAPRALAELVRMEEATDPDRSRHNVALTMVGADKGDGSLRATLDTVRRLGVEDIVAIPGPVAKRDVPACLGAGDIFLNTTDVDNVPISVLEAMACGMCVVSTSVGGIPYLLEDGVDALLVPRDDAYAMAAAVRQILDDPSLAERLSRSGRAKAASFDWSRVLPTWQDLIARVADRSR